MDYRLSLPKSQHRIEEKLIGALRNNTFPRALLIVGAAGIGKRPLATELAKALCCLSETVRPCGECLPCSMVNPSEGKSPWQWILPIEAEGKPIGGDDPAQVDARTEQTLKAIAACMGNPWSTDVFSARSTIRIDSIRDVIRELGLKERRTRVVLIPEADRMESGAANALLKTLEEVPENTYFILTTTNRSDLLPTILSRCTQIHLPEAPLSEMAEFLEKRGYSVDRIGMVWSLSSGSPGQAMIWAEERTEELRELALQVLEWGATSDSLGVMRWWSERRQSAKSKGGGLNKDDIRLVLQILSLMLGDLAQLGLGLTIRNIDCSDRLAALPYSKEGLETVQWMSEECKRMWDHLNGNVTPERVIVSLVLRWRNRPKLNLDWSSEEER